MHITGRSKLVILVVVLGGCTSSGATDSRVADLLGRDVKRNDVGRGDIGGDLAADGGVRPEACLDAKATQPPIFAWTNTGSWGSNASFTSQITSEARRCQWKSLSDQCTMYDCLAGDWSGAAATMKGSSAGKVAIGNGTGTDEVLVPDADGVYAVKSWNTVHWNAGDKITFAAEGATIPAFSLSITVPTPLVASDPFGQDAGTPTIDRSAPLALTWTPTDEKVLVIFGQQPAASAPMWNRLEVWCIFDGAAGAGTVPPVVLQQLRTDLPATGYSLGHYNRRCFDVGGFHVQPTALNCLYRPAKVK
jgi:hypothetical protein